MAQAGPGGAGLAGVRGDAGAAERPAPARVRLIAAPQGQAGGGMGRVTAYLMQEQARRGDLPSMEALESRGPGAAALSAFAVARAAARVAGLALRGRASVLHLNVAERGSVVRKGVLLGVARLFGVPVVLHLHAAQIVAFHAALPRPARALVGLVFRSAQLVVVLGEPWRRWVASLGVPEARIRVLRNGVPRLSGWRAREAGAPFRLVFLGNLFARKGIADLLAALARLGPGDAPCTLVVAGGGDVAGHEALAEGLGIGGRVRFEGWVDQAGAASCLAEADALVLPSYDEGLPLVILEALSLGVPVVCTPVGAIPEVLADGDTALLVPPGDVAALAGALRRLAGDPALAARLSERGRALYEREFTLPVFAERVAALHAEVGL
ncbi:MAG: glycosyltransferase family 4 protein [Janthinobacterium lividum]